VAVQSINSSYYNMPYYLFDLTPWL